MRQNPAPHREPDTAIPLTQAARERLEKLKQNPPDTPVVLAAKAAKQEEENK
jgi:hypothetical protein